MEHIKVKPEATLRASDLNTALITVLSMHYTVIIEQQENELLIELYPK